MTRISIICFSLTGQETGSRLEAGLKKAGMEVTFDKKSKYIPDSIKKSAGAWAGERFEDADGIIFIGACAIAVRSIAPYIAGKKTDPAVLVADECGKFVISLLSGHLGGANDLAVQCAEILGAVPVVTTATDLHHRFAVDVFAKKNDCSIFNMKAAKEVSAALLAGEKVGFYSEFPWEGELPEGLVPCDSAKQMAPETGIAVTVHSECMPFTSTVHVVPGVLALGVGCRKGKEAAAILTAAEKCREELGVYREAFSVISSIDIKKEEKGIEALASVWQIPFHTFTQAELLAVPGEFTRSSFVKEITGVDNVCERSAVLAAGQGRLLQKKVGGNGVTTAVAAREWRVHFE